MLAQQGRWAAHAALVEAIELQRRGELAQLPDDWMVDGFHHVVGNHLGIGEHLGQVVDRPGRYAQATQLGDPVVAIAQDEPLVEDALQFDPVGLARFAGGELGILDQRLQPQVTAQPDPHRAGGGGQVEHPILGVEQPVGRADGW